VRIAFLDDSEQASPPRAGLGHLLAFAAAIFPEEGLAPLPRICPTSWPHWASLRARKSSGTRPEEASYGAPTGISSRPCGGKCSNPLLNHQVRTVTVIIEHDARYQSYSKAELGKAILKWFYERVSMHLGDHNDIGIMIADKPGGRY
jgi:hypothetical protein